MREDDAGFAGHGDTSRPKGSAIASGSKGRPYALWDGLLATGVSGFISYDFCRLAGRVPRPSLTFLLQGASMRCFVSSSIDLGSRLRQLSISPAATAVIVA